ncbi:MAG: MBL fold metallo-hydrolase [Chitinophagaceae bacterium]|nr:MBL fold metallo-hydrolase [Chitinophagaceae bacterium]
MEITFLGTGTSQGVPIIACKCNVCSSENKKDNRLRSSIHIQENEISIVIDTGPDFRFQMLRENIQHLDAVVFSHSHKDHTAGLDDIRAFNYKQHSPIDVFANLRTQQDLKKEFEYIFADNKYPGIPEINFQTIDKEKNFKIKNLNFTPIEVMHYKLPVLGFRIKNFTYITDANFISENEKEKIKGSKILVLNALRIEKHISHFSLQEAIDLALELKVPTVYFTHISHLLGLHKDVEKILPKNIFLAYDGLKLKI